MDKKWLEKLASDVEAKHGTEARDRIFGDIQNIPNDYVSEKEWFNRFTRGMDELNDRGFLTNVLAERCPCVCDDIEDNIRKNFSESKTLEEFVARLDQDGLFDDTVRLEGNVLYATKQPFKKHGKHKHSGPYAEKCHCSLASCVQQPISDIFCHCCTVGYYSKMFKHALNKELKVEFVSSVISGGEGCTAAIYLPEKNA